MTPEYFESLIAETHESFNDLCKKEKSDTLLNILSKRPASGEMLGLGHAILEHVKKSPECNFKIKASGNEKSKNPRNGKRKNSNRKKS